VYPNLFWLPEWFPLLGGQPVTSFGLMMFLAFLAAGLVHRSEMKRQGFDPEITWDLLFMAVVGGILGAKLYYMFLNFPRLVEDPASLIFARGGLVWYGGFLGGVALVVWQIRRRGLHLSTQADMAAPALALAYAVGRVGCFLVGDDWGRPTGSWVGIRFPQGAPPTRVDIIEREFGIQVDPELVARFGEIVPVHPTQLYEIGLSLLIFALLWSIRKHGHAKGWLFMLWLALAGAERFFVEFFRAKDDRFFGFLTLAQLISLLLVAVGVVGVVKLRMARSPRVGRAARA
jgi:phosphatidylglycerol---prolipoprotein diacylglyceryl transferase